LTELFQDRRPRLDCVREIDIHLIMLGWLGYELRSRVLQSGDDGV
jgi:hypothetical protein